MPVNDAMIIRINLLSSDRISKEERTEFIALGYVLLVLATVILLAGHVVKVRSFSRIEDRMARAQAELTKYQAIATQVDTLQATKQVLETRKNVIDSLMASGLLYPVFLEQFARLVPTGVGFRSLSASLRADGALDVSLSADALDTYSIADFVAALTANPSCSLVELGAISSSGGPRSTAATFNATCRFARKKN